MLVPSLLQVVLLATGAVVRTFTGVSPNVQHQQLAVVDQLVVDLTLSHGDLTDLLLVQRIPIGQIYAGETAFSPQVS